MQKDLLFYTKFSDQLDISITLALFVIGVLLLFSIAVVKTNEEDYEYSAILKKISRQNESIFNQDQTITNQMNEVLSILKSKK